MAARAQVAEETHLNIESGEARKKLARMVTRLFELWNITTADQLELLGLSRTSRAQLSKYRNGGAVPSSRDMLDRIGWLLSIHKSLRLLYPRNENIRYTWVKRRNRILDDQRPLDIMKHQGLIGVARVARYLDFLRGI
ncbi:MAG: antitoxin Xre/MbcA/ParS toxin-binding domain-containing protein [Desulfobacteraceae bacterium]|nr:antitoxin Xre/MbcA/ParS toxin-binding domain-containing protein [Desulfobacteraceae bacterium]